MSAHPRPIPSRRPLDRRRLVAMVAVAAMLAYLVQAIALPVPRAEAVTVGSGSYAEGTPTGGAVPTECNNAPITNPRAHVTANFPAGAIPTNDWWTSLLWRKFNCASVSENLMAHPLAFHAYTTGLGWATRRPRASPGRPPASASTTTATREDFRLGVAGLDRGRQGRRLDRLDRQRAGPTAAAPCATTIGHGLPFVYSTMTGGNAQLTAAATPTVWTNGNAAIGFTVNGHDYVAYAPTGATWTVIGTTITSTLAGGLLLRRGAADHAEQQRRRPHRRAEQLRPVRAHPRDRHPGVLGVQPGHQRGHHDLRVHHDRPRGLRRPAPSSRSTRTSGRTWPARRPIAHDLRLAARPDAGRSSAASSFQTVIRVQRRAARGAGGRGSRPARTCHR